MWKEWQNITKVFSLTTSLRWEKVGFKYSACGLLETTMKEYKKLKKWDIHDIFIKTN